MIYSTPILTMFDKSATSTTSSRCFGRLLLPLSFCVLLIGCDSQSASAPIVKDEMRNEARNKAVTRTTEVDDGATERQQDDQAITDDNINDADEGQSLIAAAKIGKSAQTRRTPMISEKSTDSALQATLIGDYKGILPCSSCEGIAVTLNLFSDGSVLKTSVYVNPESPQAPLAESGVYRQDNTTITIVYEAKNIETYRIQDNHLVMTDENKTPNAEYTLSRK